MNQQSQDSNWYTAHFIHLVAGPNLILHLMQFLTYDQITQVVTIYLQQEGKGVGVNRFIMQTNKLSYLNLAWPCILSCSEPCSFMIHVPTSWGFPVQFRSVLNTCFRCFVPPCDCVFLTIKLDYNCSSRLGQSCRLSELWLCCAYLLISRLLSVKESFGA